MAHRPDPKTLLTGGGRWRELRYTGAGGSRSYSVYLPKGLRRTTSVPLLVALHGCHQDPISFAASTRLDNLADRHQFVLVLPQQPVVANVQRCWNWYRSEHQTAAAGEPAVLIGIVNRMIAESADWRIDASRVYAVGLSAGGAMALTVAASLPSMFAAVAVHSAPPFGSARGPNEALAAMRGATSIPAPQTRTALPPLIVFQGGRDAVVSSVNGQRVVEQWVAHYGASTGSLDGLRMLPAVVKPGSRSGSPTAPRGYRVIRWAAPGRQRVLEWWQIDGLGHAWSGGVGALPFSDARGPRATTEMWRFLSRHQLPAAR